MRRGELQCGLAPQRDGQYSMASQSASSPDSPALVGLRRRGQFLISGLLWAAVAGFVVVLSGYVLILYHYAIAMAERIRTSLGFAAPAHGPDWFTIAVLVAGPLLFMLGLALISKLV